MNHHRTGMFCALSACWAAVLVNSAAASSVRPLSDAQLVQQSALIIEGRIIEVQSAWNAAHTQIHTRVKVAVQTVIKGNIAQRRTVTLNVLGGQVGDTLMEVVGGNRYTVGEEAFLFIKDPDALLPITGLYQGKVAISLDPLTGVEDVSTRHETRGAFRTRIAAIVAEHKTQQEGQ